MSSRSTELPTAKSPAALSDAATEEVLVLDFGGQYSQLIARRIRELGVFSELLPHHASLEELEARRPRGLVLSGGPASVYSDDAPPLRPELLELGIPVLGICYGMQAMALGLGGHVEGAEVAEFGRTDLRVQESGRLLAGLPSEQTCWMSHRDTVFEPPPGFTALASSPASPVAAFESVERGLYGIQFHPEVVHTPHGSQVLETFLREVCGCEERWSPTSVVDDQVALIREQVGEGRAICGLSGGVDSSVAALIVHRALGDRLTCVLVDHGLLRKDEARQVVAAFRDHFDVPLVLVDARERFLVRLAGVDDPEQKRRIIGEEFIRVFEEEAARLENVDFLVQGTLYSDVIESGGGASGGAAMIKSHHNVGGLPERLDFDLIEPLRQLFKDEVRAVGAELGLPERLVWRQPFPGPGPRDSGRGRRGDAGAARHPARGGRHPAGGDPRRRPVPRAVAVVLCASRRAVGRRPGRRAHLRVPDRDPGSHVRRRHDRRLGAPSLRAAGEGVEPDHQRDPAREPRGARHLLEAAQHHRVGIAAPGGV